MSDSDNNSDNNEGRERGPSPKGGKTTCENRPSRQQREGNDSFANSSHEDEFFSSFKRIHRYGEQNKKSSKKVRGTNSNFSGEYNDVSCAASSRASNNSCTSTFIEGCADRDSDSPQT
jgi:hypothetical protein